MKLALFDLDNTLIPLDSDHGWSQFLIEKGILDRAEFEARNDGFYADYKAGCLDIFTFLDFQLRPLKDNPRTQLDSWHAEFMSTVIQPNIRESALSLVKKHQAEGALCLVVTATNSFITRPIVTAFGIMDMIATDPEEIDGQFTGKVIGIPNFKEGKVTRLNQWLADKSLSWDSFDSIHFYSDSINDLPLLEKATHPVAANPDEKLKSIAQTRGWPILELFQ
jgi:HAD superfamily hydrolase (TIGR01490 family)